jgi:protein TonB
MGGAVAPHRRRVAACGMSIALHTAAAGALLLLWRGPQPAAPQGSGAVPVAIVWAGSGADSPAIDAQAGTAASDQDPDAAATDVPPEPAPVESVGDAAARSAPTDEALAAQPEPASPAVPAAPVEASAKAVPEPAPAKAVPEPAPSGESVEDTPETVAASTLSDAAPHAPEEMLPLPPQAIPAPPETTPAATAETSPAPSPPRRSAASSHRLAEAPPRPVRPSRQQGAPAAARPSSAGSSTEAEAVAPAPAIAAASPPAAPVLVTAPRYRRPPAPPDYPPRALEFGLTGTVLVRALVSPGGDTQEVRVWRSSGQPLLDAAALAAVRRWAFEPAAVAGRHVAAWVEVPVHFRLN